MEYSVLENSDKTWKMEEVPESPLLSWDSTNSDDFSESQHVLPRIGDKYQVNILPCKLQMECHLLGMTDSLNLNYKGSKDEDNEQRLAEELTLPVMQISCFFHPGSVKEYEMTHVNGPFSDNELASKESLSIVAVKTDDGLHQHGLIQSADDGCAYALSDGTQFTENHADSSITDIKSKISREEDACTDSTVTAENIPDTFYSGLGKRKRGRVGWNRVKKIKVNIIDPGKQTSGSTCHSPHLKIDCKGEDANSRNSIIVPGNPSAPWSKIEEDLFILGLYIFGKNFNAVKRFVQTKEIGDILSYYYGIFFRTELYCRWAESRKMRSRNRIQRQRIFSGWRQQELLTRLIPHIPEPSKDEVPKIMKAFNEGIISMEEFVTKLKALAGPDVLVQVVGIGKGKDDLTSTNIGPTKANRVLSFHSEIPVGKACSSFSTEEIVKCLTGDFKLSKNRADDLFWEAVWPRLLARGWHSEQPEDQMLLRLRDFLVFLIPGVQKFSRRKLTRGIHYFDSVTAVLRKVASDPKLLELERDEMEGVEGKTEILCAPENAEVKNEHLGQAHSYLKPRFCTNYSDSLMITVVDTSLVSQDEHAPRIWRRVKLSLDDDTEKFQIVSSEAEDGDTVAPPLTEQCQFPKHCELKDLLNDEPEESTLIINNENSYEKIELSGMLKTSNADQNYVLSSPWKQRRLRTSIDCKGHTADASLIESDSFKVQGVTKKLHRKEETSKAALDAHPSQRCSSMLSSSQGSLERSTDMTVLGRDLISADSISNTSQHSRGSIAIPEMGLHLKLIQDQPKINAMSNTLLTGNACIDGSEAEGNSHHASSYSYPIKEPCEKTGVAHASTPCPEESKLTKPQEKDERALLENVFTVRRQSTRVRPLTTKALDAFASGVFDIKQRKRRSEKHLNLDGHRTKSLSKLVQDVETSSFNACRSDN
ncbi:hypothetical protein SUGI_0972370 [Cryptomeria japonica]|uniref:uncharacterized protein LOC131073968 n=1 Tax=Cryptomeria japonica TaxID=3369 RepID=UPI002414AD2A|nr:uncharacterized protein LOC131073968 [Cryptomeria japonica]XP_057866484.1 uncharacterized protein LOC131073968 [Cryptomeria japonica]GLJ46156.1 hypothetical protein SUGI_0972370 [Cryptomeria japonica]